MKARHRPGLSGFPDDEQPGEFDVVTEPDGQRRMWFVCPGPCKMMTAIALRPVLGPAVPSWEFDGDLTAPTLKPSINHVGCWHGWLTKGEFHT